MQKEIKLLRKRFIFIVVIIVAIIMSLIFVCVNHFTTASIEEAGNDLLRKVIHQQNVFGLFPRNDKDIQLPYFVLDVDTNNTIIASYGGYPELSDTEAIYSALNYALNSNALSGYIEEYGLKYLMETSRFGGLTVAFVDVSSQMNMIDNFRLFLLMTCISGVLLFSLIAVFLSKWAIRPVENSWNQQKQFVSDASHELKTPLTVIMTNAEMLSMDETEEDKQKHTDNILNVSHQMRTLVEDLLNLARVEKGESESYEKIDLSKISRDEVLMFEAMMFEKGLTLNENIADGIFIKGNAQRMSQVLSILLDNAAKYASSNGTVELKLIKQGRNAVLSVSNPCEPVSNAQLKEIFKRFYRVDEAHSEKGSYGLGLAIAKSICEAHNGDIHAEYSNGLIHFIASLPLS